MKFCHKIKSALLIFAFMFGGLPVQSVQAAELIVTSTADPGDGVCNAANCTLREAIAKAGSGDTIVFASSLSGATIGVGKPLLISKNLTIDASDLSSPINLSGSNSTRVLEVAGGVEVKLYHLGISNGYAEEANCGGIDNDGNLTIYDSTITYNNAGEGGGICNGGALTLIACTVSFNTAFGFHSRGAGVYNTGTLNVHNSTFAYNKAQKSFNEENGGEGGGIYNKGTVTLVHSTFEHNMAINASGNDGIGGGIYNNKGTLHLTNSILANSTNYDCINSLGTVATNNHNLIESGYCGTAFLTADPKLEVLTYNGGLTATNALASNSPAINKADDAFCPDVDQRGVLRPQGAHCDLGAYEAPDKTRLRSSAKYDGWVRETSETSGTGGAVNATANSFLLGDCDTDRQYRAILHFDTSSLPDDAILANATLKIKRYSITGEITWRSFGNIVVDIRKSAFYISPVLQKNDFQAASNMNNAATILLKPQEYNWYVGELKKSALSFINLTGATQIRLRFNKDDNDDMSADYIRFYSGNAASPAYQPMLEVEYYRE